MKKISLLLVSVLTVISLIVISFSFWYFQPQKKLNVFILDKTVTDFTFREHAPFIWVLRQKNIINPDEKLYRKDVDYYGFQPLTSNAKEKYKIKSIRLFEVLALSDILDMAFYTDSYGVLSSDLADSGLYIKPYLIYGGLNQNDYLLLREMKRKNKLIITEFNLLGSPTSELIRLKTQELFDFRWTGWTGRYFKSLQNISKNHIPLWIISAYQKQYKKQWEFSNPGVVIVHEDGRIVVLEEKKTLNTAMPAIIPTIEAVKEYNLPSFQRYGFWFDIIQTSRKNDIQAFFKLDINASGHKLLEENGLPGTFPAIISNTRDYKFFYFSGDFSDHQPIGLTAHFSGIPYLMKKIHTGSKGTNNEFFWNFYVPLLNGILDKHLVKK